MNLLTTLRLLVLIALRSLFAHRVKSGLVGSILFAGTLLLVVGGALLDTVEGTMQQSITSSLAGHLQVYDKNAEDPLAVFGSMSSQGADHGEIADFPTARAALAGVPGVRAVVPMGFTNATMFNGTELDRVLDRMRQAVEAKDAAGVKMLSEQVRVIAAELLEDVDAQAAIVSDKEKAAEDKAALQRVTTDSFWVEFEADPVAQLDWLDNHVAPLASDGKLVFLRVLGTNVDTYTKNFDRFRIVDGTNIPEGQRGILFAKRFYERWVKNKVAYELDEIHKAVTVDHKKLAEDSFLRERVQRNAKSYQKILFQLSPEDARSLTAELHAALPEVQGELPELLQALLTVDDTNVQARWELFYKLVAPRIRLYEAPVGEVATLRAYTKSGYIRAVNVKVYGTFEFEGLESSDLAAAANLTDLVTFRSLYGKMSADQQAELAEIKAASGVKELSREDAEAALFGGGSLETEAAPPEAAAPPVEEDAEALRAAGTLDTRTYTPDEMDAGVAVSAAIILDDPDDVPGGLERIESAIEGSGLSLQAVDWQAASGIVGQLIFVLRGVLYFAIMVIFLVAIVIINNAMVMATMERVTEIGTMRAIGAQRRWVEGLFLVETVVLGLVAGGLGVLVGAGIITWLGSVGIPAGADIMVLLFAGSRLYPHFTAGNLLFALVSVTAVSLLSTLYPAILASRVHPVVAMAPKE